MRSSPRTHAKGKGDYVGRFWSRVYKTPSCWLWQAAIHSQGYGVLRINCCKEKPQGDLVYAHRFAYELTKGPIPPGLELDHLCRVRACVNPDHLEPVTARENQLRGVGPSAKNAQKTHCIKGHPFDGQNLYERPDKPGQRQCMVCKREYFKEWYAKNGARRNAEDKLRRAQAQTRRVL